MNRTTRFAVHYLCNQLEAGRSVRPEDFNWLLAQASEYDVFKSWLERSIKLATENKIAIPGYIKTIVADLKEKIEADGPRSVEDHPLYSIAGGPRLPPEWYNDELQKQQDRNGYITEKDPQVSTTDAENNGFSMSTPWQEGGYALRRLYHESPKPLLVAYVSSGCGPCNMYKPQLKRVMYDLEGLANGVEINILKEPEIAKRADINGTPVVQIFFNKHLMKVFRGVQPRSDIKDYIQALINNASLTRPEAEAIMNHGA
jgi:thiol-disulfide isomerase/thioredoxin